MLLEQIIEFLNEYNVFITIGLIILVFILIIILIISLVATSKMKDKYRRIISKLIR